MAILLNNHGYDNTPWVENLTQWRPDLPVVEFSTVQQQPEWVARIRYAAVWHHPMEDLFRYPHLEAIFILGAGTEDIDAAERVPDVPIVRLIDPEILDDMAFYVLHWVLHAQRGFDVYRQQQNDKYWQRYMSPRVRDYTVLVLGLGPVGAEVARRLHINGFDVRGWNLRPVEAIDMTCFIGDHALEEAMQGVDVVVNCLPLKPNTRHLINASRMKCIKKGGVVINVSRGGIIDHSALLAQLDAGHLSLAVLDVFEQEPLPVSSPLWSHPNVVVTPHMSGATHARSAAKVLAENIARLERGETPFPLYKR
ncbi:MAG TPA: glyoxylate/hydroxypyruvate reductase A [Pseudomonadales bacterium]|nr:glyoxylate/hydroxypyruvate reductase A [Pseudomonadales bacterium]